MIAYDSKAGTVTVTADDGTSGVFAIAAFRADPEGCVAATGNGIAPQDTRTEVEKLRDQVDQLTAALTKKGAITDAEIAAASVAVDVKG